MSGNERSYDAVIIGGGPAGIIGAVTAANLGHTVAIVESQAEGLGGAGVNTATLPSKTLRETALALGDALTERVWG
jgi:NAD(P) transhydrogenase